MLSQGAHDQFNPSMVVQKLHRLYIATEAIPAYKETHMLYKETCVLYQIL